MINELVREKFFRRLDKEIPYVIRVENTGIVELPNGDLSIEETVFIPKNSQKVNHRFTATCLP
jgi:GTPase Era involved in 16S rRNA processing